MQIVQLHRRQPVQHEPEVDCRFCNGSSTALPPVPSSARYAGIVTPDDLARLGSLYNGGTITGRIKSFGTIGNHESRAGGLCGLPETIAYSEAPMVALRSCPAGLGTMFDLARTRRF